MTKKTASLFFLLYALSLLLIPQNTFCGVHSIPGLIQAEDFDDSGEGVAYHDTTPGNTIGAYRKTDVDIEPCSEGGFNVGYIDAGEWLKFTVDVISEKCYIEVRVASDMATGSFYIEIDGKDITGLLHVKRTGGWQTYITIKTEPIMLRKGTQTMKIKMDSGPFNIDWIRFQSTERNISLDAERIKGPFNTAFKKCIGAGRANEGLRADWQEQLAYVRKECGFEYIRMHGLLTDDMGVYAEDKQGKPQYNYQYIDRLFDFLLEIGMKPFVELGFMPNALARGNQTIFWWRGNVTLPKDFNKWAGLISNLVTHFTERYGKKEVAAWYFEVWNEPNLSSFFAGTQEDYFKLYKYTARAIKAVSPDYKVGGPATAGAAWVPEMIAFCSKNNVPVDFISTHTYGIGKGFLDEYGNTFTIIDPNPGSITGDIIRVRKEIASSVMPHLELHFTEWSSSYTPSDPIHDSYHQAAYILEKIRRSENAADSMSYWVFTDIFEEAGPRFTPFHGGFGLLNYQSINKTAFYAYQFMNRLGPTELVNTDSSSWACVDAAGGLQILLWDFTMTHPGGDANNQDFYNHDQKPLEKGSIKLTVSHLTAGKYSLEIFKAGYDVNDPYTMYLRMGSSNQLTLRQVEEIKKAHSGLAIGESVVEIRNGSDFIRELPLRENDLYLIILKKK